MELMRGITYREAVGAFTWASSRVHLNTTDAVSKMAMFCDNSKQAHCNAV